MPAIQLFDKLLQFPLFQGMSRDDLSQVVAHTKFGFIKFSGEKQIVEEGEACHQLLFLVNGKIRVENVADDHSYKVIEELAAPFIIQPEVVFGLTQRYTCDIYSVSDVNFISLEKDEVVRLLSDFIVFRINYMNILSTQSQKLLRQHWRHRPADLQERIIRFITSHCVHPAGTKTIKILMQRLADELNDSRLNVSVALNAMRHDGLLNLRRGIIEIPSLERLLM